jgi:hypothetical protein
MSDAPRMDPPVWMADARPMCDVRDLQVSLFPIPGADEKAFIEGVRAAARDPNKRSQRFAIRAADFWLAEQQANFRGQTEGFGVGVGLGLVIALMVYLTR